jgi:transcriptional regulator with XRE-family HTH domain
MDLGLSQGKTATVLKVSKRTLECWERDQAGPCRALMPRVNGFLGYEAERSAESVISDLVAYRRLNGLTYAGLGQRLGVHPTVVARWEAGKRLPKRPMRLRIELLLGIPQRE